MKYIYLSHFLTEKTPLYAGEKNIRLEHIRSISKGDNANASFWHLPNHAGTHIDFPKHFSENGKTSSDYTADFWIFNDPFLLDFPVKIAQIIDFEEDILQKIPIKTDFLLINTHFQQFRDQSIFWEQNAGFSPLLAKKLRQRCPNLRIIAFDLISLTSFPNRPLGREAHRAFLLENDILIVEDVNFTELLQSKGILKQIVCLPTQVAQTDGSPVTIIAQIL